MTKALDVQVGGAHYKGLPIQPVQYIHANKIGYFEGNVIKYVSRWREKNGIADLEKAKHYIDLLIEFTKEETDGSKTDCVQPSTERAEDCNIRAGVPAIHPCGADDTPSVQPERAVFPSSASEQGPISSALSDAVRVRQKQSRNEFVYDPFLRKLVPVQSGVASDGDSRLPWLPSSR